MPKTPEDLKRERALVASAAALWAQPNTVLGVGSGSTVALFIQALANRSRSEGWKPRCVAASSESERLARDAGFDVVTLERGMRLPLVVDGADEIDPLLRMTKGGGGALLRERIVAAAGAFVLILIDAAKLVERLGRFPLPVEVFPFGAGAAEGALAELGGAPALRISPKDPRKPFETDQGNWIFDCRFGDIAAPEAFAARLDSMPSVAAHGLFLDVADTALVADGSAVYMMRKGLPRVRLHVDPADAAAG